MQLQEEQSEEQEKGFKAEESETMAAIYVEESQVQQDEYWEDSQAISAPYTAIDAARSKHICLCFGCCTVGGFLPRSQEDSLNPGLLDAEGVTLAQPEPGQAQGSG